MKTISISIISLLLSTIVFSQDYVITNYSSKISQPSTSISSFIIEVLDNTDFNYRTFLKQSKESKALYRVGSDRVTKQELVKILRKTSKRSDTFLQFERTLLNHYPRLYNKLNQLEITGLYKTFKSSSFTNYVNDLPSLL